MKERRFNNMLNTYEYVEAGPTKEDKADWVLDALKAAEVDPTTEVVKPRIIFSILEPVATQTERRRVFTLGNFSAIIGKAKSKKTFLLSAIAATIIGGGVKWNKFEGGLEKEKDLVMYFDTEQGDWDCWNVVRRIAKMGGLRFKEKFRAFNLRQYTPLERCQIVEFALMMHGDEAGLVVIDGIADLANAINDEDEATRVVSLLLRWTKEYQCHIATVIHQNKNDNFATGHLGSSIMKKCEIILAVEKDPNDAYVSYVECALSRGMDFKKFKLIIRDGLPEIDDNVIEVDETMFDFDDKFDKVPF